MVIESRMTSLAELQQQRLSKLKSKVLDQLRHLLCSKLNPITHFSFLRSKFVLTQGEQEQINNVRLQTTTSDSVGKLLDIIQTKADGFNALCDSIREDGTQIFLLEALNRALQDAINSDIKFQPDIAYSSGSASSDIELKLPLPDLPPQSDTESSISGEAELSLSDDDRITTSTA